MILQLLNSFIDLFIPIFYFVGFSAVIYFFHQYFHKDIKGIWVLIKRFKLLIMLYALSNLTIYFILTFVNAWIGISWLPAMSFPMSLFIVYLYR